jgi:hypothetical protein
MFTRPHHQRIHEILLALDADFLRAHHCYFGGGTAIVLQRDEYRQSIDIDFLVSDLKRYRELRIALQAPDQVAQLFGVGRGPLVALPELRADQYGIRTALPLKPSAIKFEIVFEARIQFDLPSLQDQIAGVTTLTQVDLVASKLLANVDRWADDSVMSRDIIDLAMLQPTDETWMAALKKAEEAYGAVVLQSLEKARARLIENPQRLVRRVQALQIKTPSALLYQRLMDLI